MLWKWHEETMKDLPPNVKLSKWLPQQDLLGKLNPSIKPFAFSMRKIMRRTLNIKFSKILDG